MNRSSETSSDYAGFLNFSHMLQANRDLHKRIGRPGGLEASQVPEIIAFIDRSRATGARLSDPNERMSAEEMIGEWASRLAAAGMAPFRSAPRMAAYRPGAGGEKAPYPSAEAPDAEGLEEADDRDLQRQMNREIIRLNLTAQRWINSGENREYLLRGLQLERAIEIGNSVRFDIDVGRFIQASVRARWLRLIVRSIAVSVIAVIGVGVITYTLRDRLEFWVNRTLYWSQIADFEKTEGKKYFEFYETFGDAAKIPLFRDKTLRKLDFSTQRVDERINFSGARLVQPQFQRLQNGSALDFTNARLTDARFGTADVESGDFAGCTIENSDSGALIPQGAESCVGLQVEPPTGDKMYPPYSSFSSASAQGADFGGCTITGAQFTSAELSDGKFSNARITGSDFTRATLRGADFAGATLTDTPMCQADLTDADLRDASHDRKFLDTTAWWLAMWDAETFEDLLGRYPVSAYLRTDAYRMRTNYWQVEVNQAKSRRMASGADSDALAAAQNNLAWHLAVSGDVRDGRAMATALEAVSNTKQAYHICDSIAYVLMQQGKFDKAAELYDQMLKVTPDKVEYRLPDNPDPDYVVPQISGGVLYRYRVALVSAGRNADAQALEAVADKPNYVPTHERALLRDIPPSSGQSGIPPQLDCRLFFGNLPPG